MQHQEIDLNKREWFVLNNQMEFGPFHYVEVLKMLKSGNILGTDLIWKKGSEERAAICHTFEFLPENLELILSEANIPSLPLDLKFYFKEGKKVLSEKLSVILIVNARVIPAMSYQLDEQGATLKADAKDLKPGDKCKVLFKSGINDFKPFNSDCEITFKGDQYLGIRFMNLNPQINNMILSNLDKRAA